VGHPTGMADREVLRQDLSRITVVGPSSSPVAVVRASSWPLEHQPLPVLRHHVADRVGVALETMRQIDSQLMMRNYEGFLKR